MKNAVEVANTRIYNKSLEETKYAGMGTTLTMAYIFEDSIYIGHVGGDSRAYYITDKKILQITEDHSLVNELIKKMEVSLLQRAKIIPKEI